MSTTIVPKESGVWMLIFLAICVWVFDSFSYLSRVSSTGSGLVEGGAVTAQTIVSRCIAKVPKLLAAQPEVVFEMPLLCRYPRVTSGCCAR